LNSDATICILYAFEKGDAKETERFGAHR
jgi:hypothetical protein